eukprot:SAG31_NODE_3047_length_4749_cov_3.010968_3_plen_209_part_00
MRRRLLLKQQLWTHHANRRPQTGRTSTRECIDGAEGCGQAPAWSCGDNLPLSPRTFTIAEAAKKRGYATVHIGKVRTQQHGGHSDCPCSHSHKRVLTSDSFSGTSAISSPNPGKGCYFLVFVQLFEKYGTLIQRYTALIEKVSALIVLRVITGSTTNGRLLLRASTVSMSGTQLRRRRPRQCATAGAMQRGAPAPLVTRAEPGNSEII